MNHRSPLPALGSRHLPRSRALTLLALSAVALCAIAVSAPALAQPPATAPFDRTIVVGGGGTDLANGTALLTAINDAVLAGASATDPWLVKVEPGIFDLGSQTLLMRSFVDIEGSGRNATFIRSAGSPFSRQTSTVLVGTGVDAELRNLTVQYLSDVQGGTGIVNSSTELKLTQVNVEVEAAGNAFGIVNNAGDPRFSGVFPRVGSTSGNSSTGLSIRAGGPIVNEMFIFIATPSEKENFGISVARGGDPILEQISGVVTGGRANIGIEIRGGSARITNNRWTAAGGTTANGVLIVDSAIAEEVGDVDIKESTFEATAASINIAVDNRSAAIDVEIEDSRLVAGISPDSVFGSVAARNGVQGAATNIDQSVLLANFALQNQVAGTSFEVGATLVGGFRSFAAGSSAVCAASYDASYALLPPGC